MIHGQELALRLDDGTIVRDKSWRCVADIMFSFHAFDTNRAYGVIVDAETGEQVYPPPAKST